MTNARTSSEGQSSAACTIILLTPYVAESISRAAWTNIPYARWEVANTRIIIYKGHREMGLVMALNFFPKKTSPGP